MHKMLLFIFVFTLSITCLRANHITGGEIYYSFTANVNGINEYSGTMKLFMRCNSGLMFPTPAIIGVFDRETNARFANIEVVLTRTEIIRLDTSDPCIANPPAVCYEIAYYDFSVRVPPNQGGYLVVGQVNFRIGGINNLTSGSANVGATYVAEIPGIRDFSTATVNTSARFTTNDLVIVCAGNKFTYSFAAEARDDDRLRYYFCNALQTGTSAGLGSNIPPVNPPYTPVPYGNGFTADSPLGAGVTINEATGLITGIAPGPGIYVVTVCVDEIRSGVVIATQRKDIQVNITNCSIAAANLPASFQLCKDSTLLVAQNGSSSPLIQSYSWQLFLANGTLLQSSVQPIFSYNFTDTGTFRLRLYTNINRTCPDSTESVVRVYPGFKAGFNISGTCAGQPVQFTNTTTTTYGRVSRLFWNFGETGLANDTSNQLNPFYSYPTPGNKSIQLIAFNENGCRDTLLQDWLISPTPALGLAFRDTLICPPDEVVLNATGIGTFSWSPALGMVGAQTASPRVAPLVTTRYEVRLDGQVCFSTDSVVVRVAQINLRAMPDTTICAGDDTPLRVSTNATSISWNPASLLNNANMATPLARVTQPTLFTITGTISQCMAADSFWVYPVPYPVADAGPDVELCFDGTGIALNGTTDGALVQWIPANGLSNANILNPIARPAVTTTYVLAATDNKGCPKPGIDSVTVTILPPLLLAATPDTNVVVGQTLQLSASGAVRYEWSPASNLNNASVENPVATFLQATDGIVLQVTGYNNNCEATAFVRIRVFDKSSVFVPTAFTPNNDGFNDVFRPVLAGIKELVYFRVYNRYGQLVFETTEEGKGWNGRVKGQPQASAAYAWAVKAIDYKNDVITKGGTAILIR